MDSLSDYIACTNCHWIAIVSSGMYIHLRNLCIIGLCYQTKESSGNPFQPSYASLLFTYSILSVLAEYKLWPKKFKKPPKYIIYIYEILIAALVSNLSTRILWIPLVDFIDDLTQAASKWLIQVNDFLELETTSLLEIIANFLHDDIATVYMSYCLAILAFVWTLDATESLDAILDYLVK